MHEKNLVEKLIGGLLMINVVKSSQVAVIDKKEKKSKTKEKPKENEKTKREEVEYSDDGIYLN